MLVPAHVREKHALASVTPDLKQLYLRQAPDLLRNADCDDVDAALRRHLFENGYTSSHGNQAVHDEGQDARIHVRPWRQDADLPVHDPAGRFGMSRDTLDMVAISASVFEPPLPVHVGLCFYLVLPHVEAGEGARQVAHDRRRIERVPLDVIPRSTRGFGERAVACRPLKTPGLRAVEVFFVSRPAYRAPSRARARLAS